MSWLDALFTSGIKQVAIAGVLLPAERTLNFVSGATGADNAALSRTDVTINVLSVPTGTGFVHVTSGAVDGAARAVNVGSADVTGVLATTNGGTGLSSVGSNGQVLTVVGGVPAWSSSAATVVWANDLIGNGTTTATAQYVSSLSYSSSSAGGPIAINGTGTSLSWASGNVGPVFNQAAISGNGTITRFSAQSSSGANGNGGWFQITSGDLNGSGRRGAVQLCLGAASPQQMVEVAEPIVGQRVVALCRTNFVTSTQMPSGSGDGVVYLATAASNPTVAPASGITLYANALATPGLGLWASGLFFNRGLSGVTITQDNSSSGAGALMTLQGQPAGGASNIGGGVTIAGGGSTGAAAAATVSILPDGSTTALQLGLASTDSIWVGAQTGLLAMQLLPTGITWQKNVNTPNLQQAASSGAATNMVITAQAAGGTNKGGDLLLSGGSHAGSSQPDGNVDVTTPVSLGELEFTPSNGAQTLTNAQSDNNILNLLAGPTLGFTINIIRSISSTSMLFVRNNTSQTATIAYLTGGTVTVLTNTSALICSNGANLVKIMVGT